MTESDRPRFVDTLAALSVLPMFGRAFDDLLVRVYWAALRFLSLEAFTKATERAAQTCHQFPTPAELLELARTTDRATEAAIALERVLRLGRYSPHVGSLWSENEILAEVGEAAAQAYRAAGGGSGMRHAVHNDDHAPYARKAFLECFERVVLRDPEAGLALGQVRLPYRPAPVKAAVQAPLEQRRATIRAGLLKKPGAT